MSFISAPTLIYNVAPILFWSDYFSVSVDSATET